MKIIRKTKSIIILLLVSLATHAQTADGSNGINQANNMIRGYFDVATQLMYGIGAILALVGAVHVYYLWGQSDRGTVNKVAAAWFGSCIFLVVAPTIIKAFFGL